MSLAGPDLTVAITTCRRPVACSALVRSVSAQLGPRDQLVVVDDTPGGASVHLPGSVATVIGTGGRGAATARNAAAAAALHEWTAYLDDDVVVPAGFLGQLRQRLHQPDFDVLTANVRCDPSCGSTGRLFDERYPLSRGDRIVSYRAGTGTRRTPNDVWRVGAGAAMVWRTSVLGAIGGFPEVLGQGRRYGGAEDLAAFRAALLAGYAIRYDGTLVVHHLTPSTRRELLAKMRGYARADGALAGYVWLTRRDAGMLRHLLRDIAGTPRACATELVRALGGRSHLPVGAVASLPWRAMSGFLGFLLTHARGAGAP